MQRKEPVVSDRVFTVLPSGFYKSYTSRAV
jgi:hypothetical protein